MAELAGLTAVVTGGNRGVGRAIALAMARAGASIVIAARDSTSLLAVCGEIAQLGAKAVAIECDVTDPDSVNALGDKASSAVGYIDIVVANAGVAGPTAMMHEIDANEWRACVDVDLTGVFLTFRRFIPDMISRHSGSLIAVSSVTGKRPLWGRTPYAASKMGLIGLVRTLAVELDSHHIRVNAVCPGAVEGHRLDAVIDANAKARGIRPDRVRQELLGQSARFVSADEVAQACVFLASDRASGVTGQDINVAAGAVMN